MEVSPISCFTYFCKLINKTSVAKPRDSTSWLNARRLNCNPDVSFCRDSQLILMTDQSGVLIKEKAALAANHFPILTRINQHPSSEITTIIYSLL